jgi:hypothetical protein
MLTTITSALRAPEGRATIDLSRLDIASLFCAVVVIAGSVSC